MDYIRSKVYEFLRDLNEKQKIFWLSLISFTESSFFPIPPDPFLMLAVINKPSKWKKYFLVVSLFSVLGGIFGYIIGVYFFDLFGIKIIEFYSLQNQFQIARELFSKYSFVAVFIAAFTPVPYKIFTIASGLFGINLLLFVLASIFGRSIRFFIVAFMMKVFGEKFGKRIIKIIDIGLLILVLLLVIYTVFSFFK